MRTIAIAIVLFITSGMLYGQSRSAVSSILSRRVSFFEVKQRNLVDALCPLERRSKSRLELSTSTKQRFNGE